ncbi:hypothetical protein, partial [Mesorhizobium sp.]|uniref:hypothetical protein n=1 Tax=Mesorhizobium sp. TaxID=1871066 RepID=UPI0025EAD16D
MALWSGGLQGDNDLNTYPPLTTEIDLRVRKVGAGGRLDPAEQNVLASFLQVNRGRGWVFG